MSTITDNLTFVKQGLQTDDTITKAYLDNIEDGIKASQDSLKTVDTSLTTLTSGKIDDVVLSGSNLQFKANGTTKKTITLPSSSGTTGATDEQAAQIETNKTDIASLKVNKYDDVSLSGSNLAFKANGSTMKTITLPSSGSADTSAFFNDVSVVGSQMKFSNGSNVLKTVTLPSGSSGTGSLPDSEYLVRDAVRDYGAIGDGTKRSIKSVDPSVTLSEVKAVRSDATLDDQWDWWCLQRAINDIAEGKYHKLFLPKSYGADGANMYMISKSLRIPKMAMRFIEGNMSVIEQITDNEFILEFKEEDTWGCTFENLYLRYTNNQKAGKTKSIAIAFNPDANKVQGGWYLNTFRNFRIKNAYTAVGPYKEGRSEGSYQIAIWSCTFDTFNIKNVYFKGFDLATGIGQPNIVLNDVRCLQDDNYYNYAYDNKVKGCFIEASATNLIIKGLDLEKWHNRILNIYGGSTLIMENTHIEHHYIDRNGGTVFGEKDGLILISNDGYYDINMFDISDVKSSAGVNVPVVRIEQCNKGGLFIKGLKTQVVEGNKLSPISTDSGSMAECLFMYGDFILDESKALGLMRFNNKFYSTVEGISGGSSSSGSTSDLPIATTTSLGAVKVGGGLSINADGVLAVQGKEEESGSDVEEHAPDSGISSDNYTFLFNVMNEGGKLADYSTDDPVGEIDTGKGALLIASSAKSGAKTITNTFSLNSSSAWTLEWATNQELSTGANEGCLLSDKGDSNGKLLWLQKNGTGTVNGVTGPKIMLRVSDSVRPVWSVPSQYFNEKHNYALVYDGAGTITLYIDGASYGTQSYSFTGEFIVDRLAGGYWSSSKDYNYVGYIYYVRWSDRALSTDELHIE